MNVMEKKKIKSNIEKINQALTILPPGAKLYVDTHIDIAEKTNLTNFANPNKPIAIYGATWSNGVTGRVLRFDGDDYCGRLAYSDINIESASAESPLAVFCAFKFETTAGNGYIMSLNDTSVNEMAYGFFLDTNKLNVYLQGQSRVTTPDSSITKGNWYFAGFVWDGTNVNVYINNILSGTAAYAGTLTGRTNFRIGCRANNGVYLKGNIGLALISKGATAEDIIEWVTRNNILSRYGIS